MRGRGAIESLAASPTTIGAVTTLVVIVAVFLAYNANAGLPFVPVYRVSVDVPNASRLVTNNEVRIGGSRVGVVEELEPMQEEGEDGGSDAIARLNLKLDKQAEPLPRDSVFTVRYSSSFGLKYLEITRGAGPPAPEGFVFSGVNDVGPGGGRDGAFVELPELDDVNATFDRRTRANARINLLGYGEGFAARGDELNLAIEELNPLFTELGPVARLLDAPETRIRRFFRELGDAAGIVAPVAEEQAELFANMATTFDALSRDPEALKATISEGPATLEAGIETLPRQRRFLSRLTVLTRELRPGIADLPPTLPVLIDAIETGTPVLVDSPATNRRLERVLRELNQLVRRPSTGLALRRLEETFDEARPLSAHVVPAQTVCNYWNYWFTYLTEHITERDQVGFQQRISIIAFPPGAQTVGTGLPEPADEIVVPGEVQTSLQGYSGLQANGRAFGPGSSGGGGTFEPYEWPILHSPSYQPSGQRSSEGGDDCQSGQTGYALGSLPAPGQPASNPAHVVSDIPGSRGPTTVFFRQDGTRELRDTRVESRAP